jgi:spore germination cell wall hydrolase CwlJ-like protein
MSVWQYVLKTIATASMMVSQMPVYLPTVTQRDIEKENFLCLATNIYFEAGNQTMKGKLAVKDVTRNRGKNICEVIFKKKQFSWTEKKSWDTIKDFLDDKPKLNKLEMKVWKDSKKAAASSRRVLSKAYTHFHTVDVNPAWTGKGIVIGKHKFLKGVK